MEMATRIKTTKRKGYQNRDVGKVNELLIHALCCTYKVYDDFATPIKIV
jgi:hypothetical protein